MIKYVIMTGDSPDELMAVVQTALLDGWLPIGGVGVYIVETTDLDWNTTRKNWFMQSMVRHEKKDPEAGKGGKTSSPGQRGGLASLLRRP